VTDFGGIEVWRGGVSSWECDEMRRLDMRFYLARAMEGLVGLAAALGLPEAFREKATATLVVEDHHIRFLREARAGEPLHMVAGVLDVGESEMRFQQLLIHSLSGELAASFQTVAVHATAQDGRAFPWSAATLRRAEAIRIALPHQAAPRGLDLAPASGKASMAAAEGLGLIRLGGGAVGPADCDVFGRMRPDALVGRVSDGVPALNAVLRPEEGDAPRRRPDDVGGAVLEYRLSYQAWPRAGDRFAIRSGLADIGDRTQRLVHWILDPESGRAWATAEAVAIALDLKARRIIPISPEDQQRLRARVTPGLRL
jgi:acyl-CoA thioester hydrolase